MKRFSKVSVLILTLAIGSLQITYADSKKSAGSPPEQMYMKPTPEVPSLSGKVVETMNSGGYTYLCIEKDGKKTWAAVLEMKVTVGQEISLRSGHEMENFTSKTLNRTFDKIIFSAGPISQQGSVDKKSFHGKAMESIDSAETSTGEKIKAEKASGSNAYTVAEVFEKRTELDQKSVTVRGKVVKVSAGIMGKNWIHIQDGSGNQKDGNNDLVVTSQDIPSVGDTVTVSGTLYKDKDFGSGYKYNAIVEQANIKK
ncbi:MAG: DNA-binding protein [Planctomycetota bacterium]|nr:DNA-binding protein [Planctomycetota bacterium]MDE2216642.1 DNA-binding protein [Planctomycetota bacterium]